MTNIDTKLGKLMYLFDRARKAYPKRNLVFFDGSTEAKIALVGEAPGVDEEIQGKPFVGRAGKLLDSTLSSLGWDRKDFYVTNVVKYRPYDLNGKNRTPTDDEIEKFRPLLFKELSVISPKLIIALGRIAMKAFDINDSITKLRGSVIEKDSFKLLVTFHPAAILRNINWEPQFREDLAKITSLL